MSPAADWEEVEEEEIAQCFQRVTEEEEAERLPSHCWREKVRLWAI